MFASIVRFIREYRRYNQSLGELSRLGDRELDVRLRPDLVRVGGNDELQPRVLGGARVDISQVEPVGLAVDLEHGPRLERALDHPLDVDVPGRPLAAGGQGGG